ncbi:hypothetical protein [Helicobacter sp. MIT 11-5569]|uniref:hypothetical protein n=1 Tax=Helicobacter sp. MIT 11-5569 TaxID=1548151 RepID=UPI00051F8EE4|nr:hypothetical protein [Helicobacter sp. MIT 11-5569]
MSDETNKAKSGYQERGDTVKNGIGAIGAAIEATTKEVTKNLDVSNFGKTTLKNTPKPISIINDINSIATAQGEKAKVEAFYGVALSNTCAVAGGAAAGAVIGSVAPGIGTALGAGAGAGFGNWVCNKWIAEPTADSAYKLYQNGKEMITTATNFI